MNNTLKNHYAGRVKILITSMALLSMLSACSSYKDIPYLQDLSASPVTTGDLTNYSSLSIQPGDQLAINVGSLNPETANLFNKTLQNGGNSGNSTYGYLVSPEGDITLPLAGTIKAAGLTTAQLSSQLLQKLSPFLKEPTVSVQVLNFKVSVLGDVLRPDIYRSASERLTVTEALSLAGDLNITAKREIVLVREIDGKRMFIRLDLKKKDLFESPYFYLKSNDQLVVQPGKLKLTSADTGYRNASLVISALSLLAITISILK
ncbi:polysaccharide biosynthesis/export family protein [Hufsiella ginkgonis]|uniref:Polysaccharide export protein n=1 Tax=Hufsiella ginkgonis TaxID=2695274 RepID=A0A7K1XYH0_9SPHI|nr:polysaccharide biosynthesis/export family protein [Hufsiella ginkgonis]MXV15789.1 polysaccharide export protein [Hufsiella ginkgonis]